MIVITDSSQTELSVTTCSHGRNRDVGEPFLLAPTRITAASSRSEDIRVTELTHRRVDTWYTPAFNLSTTFLAENKNGSGECHPAVGPRDWRSKTPFERQSDGLKADRRCRTWGRVLIDS